jgi:serine/threonine protein kinase
MTPERFRQVRNLFESALERDAASRSSFLAEACQGDEPMRTEVERLLGAHLGETAPLDRGAVLPELLIGELGRMEGRRIDHYEILRELGRGGMGSVYLALRTDDVYRKPVALKVVRPEAGTQEVIQRFRREREILASLDHPNLARLLDGGTTPGGLPYFVMDYVEGQPIDTYCDERQLNVAERLKLFRSVCAAVAYAHGRGVVHRDLKPGNILVTADGTVKLLDFGIAKLLSEEANEAASVITLTGMRLMTPEYASPEQVRGDAVGTASDIYSLGVVLYELLTGHRPYRMRSRMIHEMVRVICEEEPTRPSTAVTEVEQRQSESDDKSVAVTPQSVSRARASTPQGLRRELSGDPDKIILKALRKEPAQRYPSAQAFGEDVRRHLEGLPVLAQGESVGYRTGKFLLRYRVWALAMVVMAAGVTTGAVKVTGWALFYLLLFLTILFVGYRLRRADVGHDQASRQAFPQALNLVICISAAIATAKLVPNPSQVLTLSLSSTALFYGALLARWPFRERWAGALLLDISRPKGQAAQIWIGTMAGVLILYTALSIAIFFRSHTLDPVNVAYPIGMGLYATWYFFFWGRPEIHQRGLVNFGRLLRWSKIETYTWEPAESELVVLKVRARTLFLFPWTHRIVLPSAQRSSTEAMLSRQLSEWPGQLT